MSRAISRVWLPGANQQSRLWRKVHLGIDAETLQIRAIVVTTNEVGDSPVAAELMSQIPSHEKLASFTGDGAYDTQDVHEACHYWGAIPIIPPRKGARLDYRTPTEIYVPGRLPRN